MFAKHEDALEILGPNLSNRLDLSHYDQALASGGGGAEFFISAKNKDAQWDLLKQAFSISPFIERLVSVEEFSELELACPMSYFQGQVNKSVTSAISIIQSHLGANSVNENTFDPVKDYGYLVAFLMVRDVVGLKMPTSPSFFYRTFTILNKFRKIAPHALSAVEIRQSNELVFWIEVMFGHLFMNPGDHNKLLLLASRMISKKYRKVIQASIENSVPGSLIDRMKTVSQNGKYSKLEFNILLVNIVMELVGSFQYLTGRGFAGVLATIETEFSETLATSEKTLIAFNEKMKENPRAMIDEALRHNSPTGFIFRTSSANFTHKSLQIAKGDLLCVLCDQAVKDPAAFSAPDKFCSIKTAVENQNKYLAFGSPDVAPALFAPTENHHPCFGQYFGRAMIKAMLKGLESLPPYSVESTGYQKAA